MRVIALLVGTYLCACALPAINAAARPAQLPGRKLLRLFPVDSADASAGLGRHLVQAEVKAPRDPVLTDDDVFVKWDKHTARIQRERAARAAAAADQDDVDDGDEVDEANNGRRLAQAEVKAPRDPALTDDDVFVKWDKHTARIQRERAARAAAAADRSSDDGDQDDADDDASSGRRLAGLNDDDDDDDHDDWFDDDNDHDDDD